MVELDKVVETLLAKAVSARDSGDAMRFAQAALNAANIASVPSRAIKAKAKG